MFGPDIDGILDLVPTGQTLAAQQAAQQRAGAGKTTRGLPARPTAALPQAGVAPQPTAPVGDDPFAVHTDGEGVAGVVSELTAVSVTAKAVRDAHVACVWGATEAEKIAAGVRHGQPAGPAALQLVSILQELQAPTKAFSAAYKQAQAKAGSLMTLIQAPTEDDTLAIDLQPRVTAALDRAIRAAFVVEQAGNGATDTAAAWTDFTPATAARNSLQAARRALGEAGRGMGWAPQATRADADAARFAAEACPADEERPGVCTLTPVRREEMRRKLDRHTANVLTAFTAACQVHKAALDKLIAKDRAHEKFVIDTFADIVSTALTAAVPGGKVAAFAVKLTVKFGAARLTKAAGAHDPRAKTKRMIDAVLAEMAANITGVADLAEQLDDRELIDVEAEFARLAAAGAPLFERRLAPIIEKYRAQIEPLGHNVSPRDPAAEGLAAEYGLGDYEVVQIEFNGIRRLAQVSHTSKAGLPGTAAQETYAFLRWVDPMFAPMISGAKVPDTTRTLNPDRVVNLPLAETL